MVDQGAKNLILLSRPGAREGPRLDLVRELEARGISLLIPQCDISDEPHLRAVLRECTETLPAIQVCIQASMVLEVGTFFLPLTDADLFQGWLI